MKNIVKPLIIVTSISGIFIGCATTPPQPIITIEECKVHTEKTAYDLGYSQGKAGNRIKADEYLRDCANHGVAFNTLAYEKGYYAAVGYYHCRSNVAFEAAYQGARYHIADMCPPEKQYEVQSAFQRGQKAYELKEIIRRDDAQKREVRHKYWKYESRKYETSSESERQAKMYEMKRLEQNLQQRIDYNSAVLRQMYAKK